MFATIDGKSVTGSPIQVMDYIWRYRSIHGPTSWSVSRTPIAGAAPASRAVDSLGSAEPLPGWIRSLLTPSLRMALMDPLEQEVTLALLRRLRSSEIA